MKYINVVVENKSEQTDAFFTYSAPDEICVGAKLNVPFAMQKKSPDAYCVETDVITDYDPTKIKNIESYDPERSLSAEMIDTALWMKKRYGIKYYDAIKMFTVAGKHPAKITVDASDKPEKPDYVLTDEQRCAADEINASIVSGRSETFLLKGVTNSGKTEVYMQAVEKTLELGKTAIILLPEIALATQVEERFSRRFGEEKVATLHSKLRGSEKLREWLRIRSGEARIVVGARTAVFAPLENIGLIVIDEEHESTYKSDHNPKYETIDVAYKRASYYGATLILGSATPSVVSYNRAKQGIYKLLEMKNRVGASTMPELELVDMRKEAVAGNFGIISRQLGEEITKTLKKKEQIILFLNRRGFSTHIMCPDCGYTMTCEDCGITLTYHKSCNAAVCHYCGRKYPIHKICPDCGSKFIRYTGAGTEKVEETVKSLWPEAEVDRLDIDSAISKSAIAETIKRFQRGKTDILVGTQILAKGLDFQNVGLVGIINADISLNIPDYRSSERTFQLITQVSGRAGRSSGKSRVLIQTYEPESDVIVDAANNDYESFFESELMHRSVMNYPPFSDIILVCVVEKAAKKTATDDSSDDWEYSEGDESPAMQYAAAFRNMLKDLKGIPDGSVIMKAHEEKRKLDGRRRVVFNIKAPAGSRQGFVKAYMDFKNMMLKNNADCYIEIDVNPYGIV